LRSVEDFHEGVMAGAIYIEDGSPLTPQNSRRQEKKNLTEQLKEIRHTITVQSYS